MEQTLATPARLGTRVEVDVNMVPAHGKGSFVRGLGRIHAKAVTGDQHARVGEQIAGDRPAIDLQRLKSPGALEQVLLHLRLYRAALNAFSFGSRLFGLSRENDRASPT